LIRLDFSAKCGEIIAIVGQVGAGKSSILHSLLGTGFLEVVHHEHNFRVESVHSNGFVHLKRISYPQISS
jgi:ABC-type hemin transport system ATPase subunit